MARSLAERLHDAYRKRLLFSSHAVEQMTYSERMISTREVRDIIERGEVIEEYAEDPRGLSCLLYGKTRQGRVLHVVCAPKIDHLVVVTAYVPSLIEWERDYRTRRRGGRGV